jgi:hypothetical protein
LGYDNPADLSAKSWTVMRFSETDQNGKLEWLIRKDGCMQRSGLPEGVPVCRGNYSVRQRDRRFPAGQLHRLRVLHRGLSV